MLPHKPTNDTTELAKERNRQAAERTLASWIQTSLGLIGFGAAFPSIFQAINRSFPANSPIINRGITTAIGLGSIAAGLFLLIPVLIPYHNHVKSLERDDFLDQPLHLFDLGLLVGTVAFYGLIAFAAVLLVRSLA